MIKLRRLRCSFCRKTDSEVSKLVAGPRVYICDECAAIVNRIMAGDPPDNDQQPKVETSAGRKLLARARQLFRSGGGDAQRISSLNVSG